MIKAYFATLLLLPTLASGSIQTAGNLHHPIFSQAPCFASYPFVIEHYAATMRFPAITDIRLRNPSQTPQLLELIENQLLHTLTDNGFDFSCRNKLFTTHLESTDIYLRPISSFQESYSTLPYTQITLNPSSFVHVIASARNRPLPLIGRLQQLAADLQSGDRHHHLSQSVANLIKRLREKLDKTKGI